MPGSGKSIVADELVKKGFGYVRFGQVVVDKVVESGLEVNADNEKIIREKLRKELGMGAIALLTMPKIDQLLDESSVAADGLYSWTEYKILKEKYGNLMYVVAVFSPPELRYKRLESRVEVNDNRNRFRPISRNDSKKRDYAEIENIEKGGPIAMADFTIVNTSTISEAIKKLNKFLAEIK